MTKPMDELKRKQFCQRIADQETIKALKATGQPDIWYEIYQAYMTGWITGKKWSKLPEKTIQQIRDHIHRLFRGI